VAGMDVVKKIQAAPVREATQNLEPPIQIVKAARKSPIARERSGRPLQ